MPDYRVYCLDGAGKIQSADWIEATNDMAAVIAAREMKKYAIKCEVWERERLVATLTAPDVTDGPG